MNKARRKELSKAIDMLYEALNIIESVSIEEGDAYDNLPESLQDSDRGQAMQDYIDIMDDAYSTIEDSITNLEEVIG